MNAGPTVQADAGAHRGMVSLDGLKEAIHIGTDDLPFVELRPGTEIQLLQVDLNQGVWILRARYAPGTVLNTHYHTGPVLAFTLAGMWYYREYPEQQNRAGSYLYEPAHSIHSLTVPDTNTEMTDVWFAITGANLDVDGKGNVTAVADARSILASYRNLCKAGGVDCGKLVVIGE